MSLLSAGAAASRSAAGIVAKAVRGFQVVRIDGYSLTKAMLPGGESIGACFIVGSHMCQWQVDYYPNGADRCKPDSDHIALYLRLLSTTGAGGYNVHKGLERVRAQFKFGLLDAAGKPAYELPAETGIFTACFRRPDPEKKDDDGQQQELGCGHGEFISREELERRRDSLLKDDCLAVRCDVGFMELKRLDLGQKYGNSGHRCPPPHVWYDSDDDDGDETPRQRRKHRYQPPDDQEFIRRCLAEQRRHK